MNESVTNTNMQHVLLLALSLFAVIQGASLSTHFSERLAEGFRLSKYIVGFIVVSFISILPETFIAIGAAFQGDASLGIGTILSSNVADLTLIFGIVAFVAGKKGLKIEKSTLKKLYVYPLFLAIPGLLALDGSFTRSEGIALIIIGVIFYIFTFKKSIGLSSNSPETKHKWRNAVFLVLSMALLLLGAHFTVESTLGLADAVGISATLIGVVIVALGTTIPELFFSVKAVRRKRPELAIGDLLGSVLADATIVIGLVALVNPVTFPQRIAYIAGGFMVAASVLLLYFFRSKLRVGRQEALLLASVWVVYIAFEFLFSGLDW